MVISSKFLDALTPSSIRSITAKIRDKAKDGIQVVSFAGGLPSKEDVYKRQVHHSWIAGSPPPGWKQRTAAPPLCRRGR